MDRELRIIIRALSTGDLTVISDFISYYYRQGDHPQRVFDELRTYISTEDAEIALTAYHDATRDDLFNLLKTRNAGAIAGLTKIFAERGWIHYGKGTKIWDGFVEINYDIRVKGVCDRCEGTGIPKNCRLCETDYPCPHFNTNSPLDNRVVVSPMRSYSYPKVVFVRCPYCEREHSHKYTDIDTPHRMAPRTSDCYPGGEYEIQFTPNCSCLKNKGTVIVKTFHIFKEAFYRHVWANLHPPDIEIDTFRCGKNYCNILLEDDPEGPLKHATLHGYVLDKAIPHNRNITIRVPVARLDLEGTADLVYWDMIRAHQGLPRPGRRRNPGDEELRKVELDYAVDPSDETLKKVIIERLRKDKSLEDLPSYANQWAIQMQCRHIWKERSYTGSLWEPELPGYVTHTETWDQCAICDLTR